MRLRNGHAPYIMNPGEHSAFTISETLGELRSAVIQSGIDESSIEDTCVFHIDVYPTVYEYHSIFLMSNSQLKKVRYDECLDSS